MDNIRRNKAEVKIEYPSTPTPLDSNHRAERSNRDDNSIASAETEKITNCTRAREGKKIEEGTRWSKTGRLNSMPLGTQHGKPYATKKKYQQI